MTRRYVIRWFGPVDRDQIRRIERLSFPAPMRADEIPGNGQWLCQVVDLVDFGTVGFAIWEAKGATLSIIRMAVHPEFRRSGFGRALIDHLKEIAARGQFGIVADIDARNLDGALFLQKMGFTGKSFGETKYRFKLAREKVKSA